MKLWMERHRRTAVVAMLAAVAALSVLIAYLLRFDLSVPPEHRHRIPLVMAAAVLIKLAVFLAGGLYHG